MMTKYGLPRIKRRIFVLYSAGSAVFLLRLLNSQLHYYSSCCWPKSPRTQPVPAAAAPRLLLRVHKLSASLIVCINWRLESHLRGTRTKGTTLSFRSTATCNCCNSQNTSHQFEWSGRRRRSTITTTTAHLRISSQSGCSPLAAGRWAWNLQGSSKMHAFGPNSRRICFSATSTLTARFEQSAGAKKPSAARRLRDRYVSVVKCGEDRYENKRY